MEKQNIEQPAAATGIDADELAEKIGRAVAAALKQIKVYVLESEITQAQDSIKTIVEQSKF